VCFSANLLGLLSALGDNIIVASRREGDTFTLTSVDSCNLFTSRFRTQLGEFNPLDYKFKDINKLLESEEKTIQSKSNTLNIGQMEHEIIELKGVINNNSNVGARNKEISNKDSKLKHRSIKISMIAAKVRFLKKLSFAQDSKKVFEATLISYFNRNFK